MGILQNMVVIPYKEVRYMVVIPDEIIFLGDVTRYFIWSRFKPTCRGEKGMWLFGNDGEFDCKQAQVSWSGFCWSEGIPKETAIQFLKNLVKFNSSIYWFYKTASFIFSFCGLHLKRRWYRKGGGSVRGGDFSQLVVS